MKTLGQILLWLGFLSGALATVYRLPAKGTQSVKLLQEARAAVATHGSVDAAAAAVGVEPATLESRLEQADQLPNDLVDALADVVVPAEGANPIPWTWYLVSAGVAAAGVVLLWTERSNKGQQTEESRTGLKTIEGHLADAILTVAELRKQLDSLPPSRITAFIDDRLADDLREFAEGRDAITAEYGLAIFAEVMSQFAAGERAINRAWSAAADGYLDEASDCLERGARLLGEAQQLLQTARQPS